MYHVGSCREPSDFSRNSRSHRANSILLERKSMSFTHRSVGTHHLQGSDALSVCGSVNLLPPRYTISESSRRALGRTILCQDGFFDRSREHTCGLDLVNLLLNHAYVVCFTPGRTYGAHDGPIGRSPCLRLHHCIDWDLSSVLLTKLPPSEVPMSSFVLQMRLHTHPH